MACIVNRWKTETDKFCASTFKLLALTDLFSQPRCSSKSARKRLSRCDSASFTARSLSWAALPEVQNCDPSPDKRIYWPQRSLEEPMGNTFLVEETCEFLNIWKQIVQNMLIFYSIVIFLLWGQNHITTISIKVLLSHVPLLFSLPP